MLNALHTTGKSSEQHRPHTLSAHGRQDDSEVTEVCDTTTLICGAIEVERLDSSLLFDALPDCIVISPERSAVHSPLRRLLDLLALETCGESNACQLVLDKLAGALFAMVLRHYVHTCCPSNGIFAALVDARLGPVLAALHARIDQRRQLGQLAAIAGMSRSAFARHFRCMLGMPPCDYITRWRMAHAEVLLRDARRSVAQVAESLGYSTEAAFRRAFKRFFGVGPGRVRRECNASPAPTPASHEIGRELPHIPHGRHVPRCGAVAKC